MLKTAGSIIFTTKFSILQHLQNRKISIFCFDLFSKTKFLAGNSVFLLLYLPRPSHTHTYTFSFFSHSHLITGFSLCGGGKYPTLSMDQAGGELPMNLTVHLGACIFANSSCRAPLHTFQIFMPRISPRLQHTGAHRCTQQYSSSE